MELFFNELSIKNEESIAPNAAAAMVDVYRELLKYQITTCRIAPADHARLFQMFCDMPESANIKNFYFSFFRSPYESEAVEGKQEEYCGHHWTYGSEECFGFALAYLLNSASFSIYGAKWNTPFVDSLQDKQPIKIRNICRMEHVGIHMPQLQAEQEGELVQCGIQSADKKIVLRQDHGMDVLRDYAKRLVRCPYVVEVVNSLPYNPRERKFIRRVRENGLVEIVLPWTDAKLGLIVRTTGRTLYETERIAKIIKDEFGYI